MSAGECPSQQRLTCQFRIQLPNTSHDFLKFDYRWSSVSSYSKGFSEGEFLMTSSNVDSFKNFTSNDEKGDLKFPREKFNITF